MLCIITREASRQDPLLPLIPAPPTGHLIIAIPLAPAQPRPQGTQASRAVLTIPVCAGTRGQVGAQHHGRDQVLKGWDLNQRQPEEGENKGRLRRKDREGRRLLQKPRLPEEHSWEGKQVRIPKCGRLPHILHVP